MPTSNHHPLGYQAPIISPFGALCEQHVDEVASYWRQWQVAMKQPIYDKQSLKILETKIRSNIAGMMINADDSWAYIACSFSDAEPEHIFTAAQIAFRSYKTSRIRELMDLVGSNPIPAQGLVSALAWLPQDIAHPWLSRFLKSKDLNHKTLALKTCRLRGEMPHKYLSRFLQQKNYTSHKQLYIESLRIVGELKIFDEKDFLYKALKDEEPIRFWGLYSLILLGEHALAKQLAPYIFEENDYQSKAINLAFRVLPIDEAWRLIAELQQHSRYKRSSIQALSCLADSAALPWLLEQMRDPNLARICGEAFFNITGINLDTSGLSIEQPYTTEQLIKLDPEQTLDQIDQDEHLPWPDTEKIWWYWHNSDRVKLKQGERYLLGKPVNPTNLAQALDSGKQRQRRAAALELAILVDDYCLYSTRGVCTLER